jgi:ADP-ribose pyrophosphatase YjhB (NUDIX family)
MRPSVALVHDLVSELALVDDLEAEHRSDTLRWLRTTDDVFRRVKPATPTRHLVSYVVPIDRTDGSVLLVDHVNAGLWLPPGGHVEPDEHPARTARREAREELGIAADCDSSWLIIRTVNRFCEDPSLSMAGDHRNTTRSRTVQAVVVTR